MAEHQANQKQSHVAALDGLRFVAALSVVVSHATYQIYPPGNWEGMSYAVWNLTHLANFGMTLFFVLSGFVIHWNYRSVVQQPGGLWAFFVARWSRLYPLFLIFIVGTIYGVATKGQAWRMAEMTPYFLTFTTSWWYWQFDGAYIFDGLNNAVLGVTWSLATEAFFYCTYPLLAPLTSKLSQRGAAVGLVVAGAVGAAMSLAFVSYSNEIIAFASKHLGITTGSQFLFWLGFHSPWMRFPSFLVGVFAAQLSLSGLPDTADRGRHCRSPLLGRDLCSRPAQDLDSHGRLERACDLFRRHLPLRFDPALIVRIGSVHAAHDLGRRGQLFPLSAA